MEAAGIEPATGLRNPRNPSRLPGARTRRLQLGYNFGRAGLQVRWRPQREEWRPHPGAPGGALSARNSVSRESRAARRCSRWGSVRVPRCCVVAKGPRPYSRSTLAHRRSTTTPPALAPRRPTPQGLPRSLRTQKISIELSRLRPVRRRNWARDSRSSDSLLIRRSRH